MISLIRNSPYSIMRSSINLATPRKKEQKQLGKLLSISLGIFIVVFIFAASVLGYYLYLRSKISTLDKKEVALQDQVNLLAREKANALVIKDRLSNIREVLASRGNVNQKVIAVLSILPDNLDIQTFSVTGNVLMVELVSPDLGAFNQLIESDILKAEAETTTPILRTDINDFKIVEESPNYTMNLTFEFTE